MNTTKLRTLLVLGLLAAALGYATFAGAAEVQLVTTNDLQVAPPTGAGGDSRNPIITPDGWYVLFASTAGNLTPGGSDGVSPIGTLPKLNIFLRDRTNGTTTLVSVNQTGRGGGNADSVPVAISTDGQFVLFESNASDLVAGDTNGASDVFLRDVVAGATSLVSASTNGRVGNGASWQSAVTLDGRYVAFSSAANNLVNDDTNGIADIFVWDRQTGTTVLASPGAVNGSARPCSSDSPLLTPDGRYVAFLSSAVQLVPGYTVQNEVYVRDLLAGVTRVVSTNAHQSLSGSIVSYSHAISDDGQYVVFESSPSASGTSGLIFRYNLWTEMSQVVATNAVAARSGNTGFRHFRSLDMTPDGRWITFVGQTNSTSQVYVWDGQTGGTELASLDLLGNPPANTFCDYPVLDATGLYVAFLSTASNLTTNTVAEGTHLYVRDLQEHLTILVDAAPGEAASAKDFLNVPAFTPGGGLIAFDCTDADLVSGDNNRAYDIFVRDVGSGAFDLISARATSLASETPAGIALGPTLSASADGRYIAFASVPGDLLAGCTNPYRAIFVRDLFGGSNLLASVDTNGLPGLDRNAADPSISGDSRFVAFSSSADNVVPGDNNKLQDVFVRDLQNQLTLLVSVSTNGVSPGNGASSAPVLSADGGVVLFRSRANNLAAGPWSSIYDNLFVRKLQAGITYSIAPSGVSCAAMSSDGRWVGFSGMTGNIYVWDTQLNARVFTNVTSPPTSIAISSDGNRLAGLRGSQVYVADRGAGSNYVLVASNSPTLISHVGLQFSTSGRFLAFCTAEPATAYDTNGIADVYVYDFDTQVFTLISRNYDAPLPGNGPSDSPVISADGRFVAFRSSASNLVALDTNGVPDVFLHDLQTGTTTPLSVSAGAIATGNNRSLAPLFSTDGRTLVFQSWGSDVVPRDFNQGPDIFALRLAASPYVPAFAVQIIYAPASSQPLRLSWPAVSGVTYAVQYRADLRDPSWLDLDCAISVVGDRAYASDLSAGPGQRFYRISAASQP